MNNIKAENSLSGRNTKSKEPSAKGASLSAAKRK